MGDYWIKNTVRHFFYIISPFYIYKFTYLLIFTFWYIFQSKNNLNFKKLKPAFQHIR